MTRSSVSWSYRKSKYGQTALTEVKTSSRRQPSLRGLVCRRYATWLQRVRPTVCLQNNMCVLQVCHTLPQHFETGFYWLHSSRCLRFPGVKLLLWYFSAANLCFVPQRTSQTCSTLSLTSFFCFVFFSLGSKSDFQAINKWIMFSLLFGCLSRTSAVTSVLKKLPWAWYMLKYLTQEEWASMQPLGI